MIDTRSDRTLSSTAVPHGSIEKQEIRRWICAAACGCPRSSAADRRYAERLFSQDAAARAATARAAAGGYRPATTAAAAAADSAAAAATAQVQKPLTEEELFARKTLDQLNAEAPLADVMFDYDQFAIRDDQRAALQRNADYLRRWTSVRVSVEGHADLRGTTEYNLALGERRGERGTGIPDGTRHRCRSVRGLEQGRRDAALHGGQRRVPRAQPARALRDHREITADPEVRPLISSTMALAAAAGCGAAMMGRPTTMKLAPARIASAGPIVLA